MRFARVLADAKQHISKGAGNDVSANLRQLLAEVQRRTQPIAKLLVQQNDRGLVLSLEKIDWAESERNYVRLHVGNQTYTVRGTIEGLEERIDRAQFLRLNRSCLVRIDFIREMQKWSHGEYRVVLLSGDTRTWTRRYLNRHPELLQKF